MKRISLLAAALAATCIVGCHRDDTIAAPGATNVEQVGTTTTTAAALAATTTTAAASPAAPATSSLEGVGGGTAPGMPASFPQSSSLATDRGATAPSAPAGTSATALDSTVVPALFVNRPAAEPPASDPLVVPGLESTTQYGYQGPSGGPMRPGAASNPDTTSGAR